MCSLKRFAIIATLLIVISFSFITCSPKVYGDPSRLIRINVDEKFIIAAWYDGPYIPKAIYDANLIKGGKGDCITDGKSTLQYYNFVGLKKGETTITLPLTSVKKKIFKVQIE